MLVTLSDGTQVTLLDYISHKASKAVVEIFDKHYERGEDGELREIGDVTISEVKLNKAIEVRTLHTISSISKDGNAIKPSQDWLDNLRGEDYDALAAAVHKVKDSEMGEEKLKKNAR